MGKVCREVEEGRASKRLQYVFMVQRFRAYFVIAVVFSTAKQLSFCCSFEPIHYTSII
jgi:hypothetical protein